MAIQFYLGFYQGVKIQAAHIHGGIENLSETKIAIDCRHGCYFSGNLYCLFLLFLRWGSTNCTGTNSVKPGKTSENLMKLE
jgi:hypothetical protein